MKKHGGITAKQKEQLGALTRAKKIIGHNWEKLCEVWRSWLSDSEQRQVKESHLNAAVEKKEEITASLAVDKAQQHLFERKSVVKDYQLKTEALRRSYGEVLPEAIAKSVEEGAYFQRQIGKHTYLTTQQAVEEEYKMLQLARSGMQQHFPLNSAYQIKATYLNEEQQAAIHHALNDTNQVTIISGGAGVGKTTLFKEIEAGIEEKGISFKGFAPSASASRGVMRQEGFEGADTLAQLLLNKQLQEQTKNGVIWVDEAGMIGNKDMTALLHITKEQNARLLLSGDYRQHPSVSAGDSLRILEQEAGIPVARVNKIQRQRHNPNYKMAVRMAADGKIDAALLKLDRMGAVKEIQNKTERLNQLVSDYMESTVEGKSALIVAPTHKEGNQVTDQLRTKLKEDGQLGVEECTIIQLKNTHWTEENKADVYHYRTGSKVVEFHQNAKGHRRGERLDVLPTTDQIHCLNVQTKEEKKVLNLAHAKRFSVYEKQNITIARGERIRITKGGKTREGTRINNGDHYTVMGFTEEGHLRLHTGKTLDKNFGHINYGYVTTSHAAQGKTVDHIFIAQSSDSLAASSRQQFYVSLSRGRHQCRIYTDDKKALEQAVKQDGQRMSAREVAQLDHRKRRKIDTPSSSAIKKEHGRSKRL